MTPTQSPPPGARLIRHAGDSLTFVLEDPSGGALGGVPFLRTNLRHAPRRRAAVIALVERAEPLPSDDWEDLPMTLESPSRAVLTLPLTEPGVFEAKAFLLTEHTHPTWPDGSGNTAIKVEPAWTIARNSIYAAFVRLFLPGGVAVPEESVMAPLDAAGCTVIPPSGTFREFATRLDHILTDMNFRIVLLLPPFPTPTTWGRMGRYGSPFAARDFYDIDPALAEFDRGATPLDQFRELADAIHARDGRLFIDIPINHTGWASQIMTHHPEWFCREPDGSFESPGAWGVVWADLVKLDYAHRGLWQEMAEIFLFWCRQGVDGFRCDAGYMVPLPVWEYITAHVRTKFPDTVFLLEGLGGPIQTMLDLSTTGGLNWAYSELFQNYDRGAVDWYLPQAISQSITHGAQVNFAETHDNSRLAAVSAPWARMRTALAALTSPAGGWGLTCGVEWLAGEQIRVHGVTALCEGATENLVPEITRLNALLRDPAFRAGADLRLITRNGGSGIALRRVAPDGSDRVLVLVNLDAGQPATVQWHPDDFPGGRLHCRLTDSERLPVPHGGWLQLPLEPGEALCLAPAPAPVAVVEPHLEQAAAAQAALTARWLGVDAATRQSPHDLGRDLLTDPAAWCRTLTALPFAPLTHVQWPLDARRTVVWLPGDLLYVTADSAFRWQLETPHHGTSAGTSLAGAAHHFALLPPPDAGVATATLHLKLIAPGTVSRGAVELVRPGALTDPATGVSGAEIRQDPDLHFVLTNGTGAMSHLRAAWGSVRTQYDSLLAANPHPDFPTDRRMLFNRCRAWVVRRGYSMELNADWTVRAVMTSQGSARWEFRIPCGDGHWVDLHAHVHLRPGSDAVTLTFFRLPGDDAGEIALILRPDVEDRNFHEKWPFTDENMATLLGVMTFTPDGFVQPCHHGGLHVTCGRGGFVREPERLGVGHEEDASRGLGGGSTVFSPGWFGVPLAAGEPVHVVAALVPRGAPVPEPWIPDLSAAPGFTVADAARQFIVKRDDTLTVIAGYPWFLDWGRDTLICLRGIAAAGELAAVRSILITFARYEKLGTLPNMIRGGDDSNRDTSDAPLWFFAATADLLAREGSDAFLDESAGSGRSIREVLAALGRGYRDGTPNGIRMDPATALVYSPSHYTWMDTNYPAGTPRQGYPVEIQALWIAALTLLSRVDPDPCWPDLAARARTSLTTLFRREGGWLSDCLHAAPGQSAADAVADDHLRPNQLLAVTLGAIDDPELCTSIVANCMELLIPGALRTLADRRVEFALPVYRDGQLLNDPHHPFAPDYAGDEDTRRKPAYHNGTGWPWLMPMLAEAMVMAWGPAALPRAEGILASSLPLFRRFCVGSLEEVVDAATPHTARGCGAQAWSITEWLRVREWLKTQEQPLK